VNIPMREDFSGFFVARRFGVVFYGVSALFLLSAGLFGRCFCLWLKDIERCVFIEKSADWMFA